jgi:hypothetical protein
MSTDVPRLRQAGLHHAYTQPGDETEALFRSHCLGRVGEERQAHLPICHLSFIVLDVAITPSCIWASSLMTDHNEKALNSAVRNRKNLVLTLMMLSLSMALPIDALK